MTRTHTTQTAGEAGLIELDIDFPDVCTQGIAFLAHPITTQGGSKDHKVITTMAKALVSGGWLVVRPNCRGAGRSEGEYNAGPGEAADFLRVIDAVFEMREVAEALPVGGRAVFGGFSFGAYVMSLAAQIRKPAAMRARQFINLTSFTRAAPRSSFMRKTTNWHRSTRFCPGPTSTI